MQKSTAVKLRKTAAIASLMSSGLFAASYLAGTEPRGVRNFNPGNIKMPTRNGKPVSAGWRGSVHVSENTDGTFEQFFDWHYGIRAMILVLFNGYFAQGLNTVAKIINRYAPSSENNTANYINYVARRTGFGANRPIKTTPENILKLIKAMIELEIGQAYERQIPESAYKKAIALVGKDRFTTKAVVGAGAVITLASLATAFLITRANKAS